MVPEISSATDIIFFHFGQFFAHVLPKNLNNQNFEKKKKKKTPGDIIILNKCTKNTTYSKRDVREKALSGIKEELGIEINTIKSKWNSLRAQHGRELAKESKTKSGQSTDDVYEISWPFMEKMRFVEQVKKTARSTSTLKLSDLQSVIEGESELEDEAQNDLLNSDSNRSLVEKSAKRKCVNPTE